MSQIVAAYAPWKLNAYRIENVVVYPWVIGYKYNPFNQHPWQYLDIDMSVPRKSRPMRMLLCAGRLPRSRSRALRAAAKWADPGKVLRTAIMIAETGFDPQAAQDFYSNTINSAIFEPPYEYDYLARPHRSCPRAAEALPEISADGLTWTIRIRKGIHFADDPAFKGQKRELTAQRFRVRDQAPRRSQGSLPQRFPVRDRLAGLDKALEEAQRHAASSTTTRTSRACARRPLHAAAQARRARLRVPAAPHAPRSSAAVAREVIEAYGDASGWAMANPVGTGPFKLKEWRRAQRIVLEANPNYREETFPALPANADADAKAALRGDEGQAPAAGRPRRGRGDRGVEPAAARRSTATSSISSTCRATSCRACWTTRTGSQPQYAKQGVTLQRAEEAGLAFFAYFNMNDPVVGGYTPEKVALRRALLMGYNPAELIRVGLQGQGSVANQPIPPEVPGHVPGIKNATPHDPGAGARAARQVRLQGPQRRRLSRAARRQAARAVDGLGARPARTASATSCGSRTCATSACKIEFQHQKWPDLVKMARANQLQMWQVGWTATSADSYMELAYGPNGGQSNLSFFKNAEYDDLLKQSRRARTDAERDKLYARMTEIIAAYAPMGGGIYRIENTIAKPWIVGYKKDSFRSQPWRFVDVDSRRMKAAQ